MEEILQALDAFKLFFKELGSYLAKNLHLSFLKFEAGKGIFVAALYRQRGKLSRRLVHSGMAALAALGVVIAPVVAQEFPGRSVDPWQIPPSGTVLSVTTDSPEVETLVSDKVRDKVLE